MTKLAASYRLTREGRELLRALAEHYAISQAGVIEMSVRVLAERIGFKAPGKSAAVTRTKRTK